MPTTVEAFTSLGLSLALGLLIGLERGWHDRDDAEGARVAGVRSFALIGLLGGVNGLLVPLVHPLLPAAVLAGLVALLTVGQVLRAERLQDLGVTSVVAAMLTFLLGVATGLGLSGPAAMGAVATALILGYKARLHRFVATLSGRELHAGLLLLAMSVIVLPVLPDRGFGPWAALNPYQIWWMVVLIAGISFAGYAAMKIAGSEAGALATGLLGGIASSTALTLHFARLARRADGQQAASLLASGILLACGTMFPRMVIVAGVIAPTLVGHLAGPAAVMAGLVYGGALAFWWRAHGRSAAPEIALANPLEVRTALFFGALLGAVMLAAAALRDTVGDSGLLALAAVSGLTDVDAITLTLADMVRLDGQVGVAVLGIVIAAGANSLVKAAMAFIVGGAALGIRTALPLCAAALAGPAVVWLAAASAGAV